MQLTALLLFVSYLFGNIARINTLNSSYIYWYGLFVFLAVYAYTELMDRNRYALIWELLKNLFGAGIIFYTGDWFGTNQWHSSIAYLILAWFIVTTIITAWFVQQHRQEDKLIIV